jgi:hypothetical protein
MRLPIDTNPNLTRRMLLLLESVPVHGDEVYAAARRALTGATAPASKQQQQQHSATAALILGAARLAGAAR